MKFIIVLIVSMTFFVSISAQNVGIGTPMPAEKLDVNGKTKTINFQMTNGASNGYQLKSDANGNASWIAPSFGGGHGGGIIPFSTGVPLNGSSVVSAAPILMGFGSHTVEVINASGESTMPPEAGGFSFVVPYTGTIQNLSISADLLVSSIAFINFTPLIYTFTVYRSSSPQDGISHISDPYQTTPFSSTLTFGGTGLMFPGSFYSAANINTGSLAVNAGDRIGVRVRTSSSSDISASDISQVSFNATLFYTY